MTAGAGRPPVAQADLDAVSRQLGREARGVAEVAHRCPCGEPDVVRTEPRLPDGTPFPTSFYATCPRLTGALSTLESRGVMREMNERLEADEGLRGRYAAAHLDYLERRSQLGDVSEIAGVSAGGMPSRVKCLHVLVAHSLGAGPGVNPLGDEALALLGPWWDRHPCSAAAPETGPAPSQPHAADAGSAT
ncbi:DUF501 domain-containing protein [Fodinibacter luteus]|uniref:DUF501 domain-containing protein n=1 Tax=Fodinibacter luteus TaxID=552064 RepID=A0ABP8JVL0_9MICO